MRLQLPIVSIGIGVIASLVLHALAVIVSRVTYGVALADAIMVRFQSLELTLSAFVGALAGLVACIPGHRWYVHTIVGGFSAGILSARSCLTDALSYDRSSGLVNITFITSLLLWFLVGASTSAIVFFAYTARVNPLKKNPDNVPV